MIRTQPVWIQSLHEIGCVAVALDCHTCRYCCDAVHCVQGVFTNDVKRIDPYCVRVHRCLQYSWRIKGWSRKHRQWMERPQDIVNCAKMIGYWVATESNVTTEGLKLEFNRLTLPADDSHCLRYPCTHCVSHHDSCTGD